MGHERRMGLDGEGAGTLREEVGIPLLRGDSRCVWGRVVRLQCDGWTAARAPHPGCSFVSPGVL